MAAKVEKRVSFARVKNPMPYPDFLDVQLKSFRDFLQLDTPPEDRKNDGLILAFFLPKDNAEIAQLIEH